MWRQAPEFRPRGRRQSSFSPVGRLSSQIDQHRRPQACAIRERSDMCERTSRLQSCFHSLCRLSPRSGAGHSANSRYAQRSYGPFLCTAWLGEALGSFWVCTGFGKRSALRLHRYSTEIPTAPTSGLDAGNRGELKKLPVPACRTQKRLENTAAPVQGMVGRHSGTL